MILCTFSEGRDCSELRFDCHSNNPCGPTTCVPEQSRYLGLWNNRYVECGDNGECTEKFCDKTYVFNEDQQDCVSKFSTKRG